MSLVQIKEVSTGAVQFVDSDDTIPYGWELVTELILDLCLNDCYVCECGSDKIGGPGHSFWCPKYGERK